MHGRSVEALCHAVPGRRTRKMRHIAARGESNRRGTWAGCAQSRLPRRSTPLVTKQSMLGSRWRAMLGEELSQRLIDGGRVTKDGGDVGLEKNYVRAFPIRLVVLATN